MDYSKILDSVIKLPLESLIETVSLLDSARNAERLYTAFERTENQVLQINSLEKLSREMKVETRDK